jgi:hypothetical protein
MTSNRAGGLCAAAFAVLTIAAVFVEAPPGGTYSASDVAHFTAKSHRPLVFLALYLSAAAALALLGLVAHMHARATGATRKLLVLGTGGIAAVSIPIGVGIAGGVPIALMVGGGKAIDPRVTYMIVESGAVLLLGLAMTMLGVMLVAAARDMPGWTKAATYVGGVAGLLSFAWFPLFLVALWGIVVGIALAFTPDPAATNLQIPAQARESTASPVAAG